MHVTSYLGDLDLYQTQHDTWSWVIGIDMMYDKNTATK